MTIVVRSGNSPRPASGWSTNLRVVETSTLSSAAALPGETSKPMSSHNHDIQPTRTHIEVCVRLRPLFVEGDSSSTSSSRSFLEQHQPPQHPSSSRLQLPRKPQHLLVRAPSASVSPPRNPLRTNHPPLQSHSAGQRYAWQLCSDDTVAQSPHTDVVPGRTHQYTLDKVYGPESTTQQLYDASVKPLVRAALEGYHTSVLAYGQTSTGKTFTMTGTPHRPGVIPLAVRECFECILRQQQQQQVQPPNRSRQREYLLRVSYLEVYKEHIRDLLVPSPISGVGSGSGGRGGPAPAAAVPIRLFDSADGLVIKGLVEEVVTSPDQVYQLLAQGEARRQVGATHLNQHSSRSHAIFRLWIESREQGSSHGGGNGGSGGVRLSSLSLVDLAGSESVRLTGSTERQQEGHYINKSLMTLGKVVYALSEESGLPAHHHPSMLNKRHVPYRDSKLTRLLQPSLSGAAHVVLICCISPLSSHVEESHNTFKFAIRAKRIPQHAVVQDEVSDDKTLLQSYRDEIEELKRQLREARDEQQQLQVARRRHHNPATAPLSIATTSSSASYFNLCDPIDEEDEISELVKSIQNMERLILKGRPHPSRNNSGADSTVATTTDASTTGGDCYDEYACDNAPDEVDDDDDLLTSLDDEPRSSHSHSSHGMVTTSTSPPPPPPRRIRVPGAPPSPAVSRFVGATTIAAPDDASSRDHDLHAELSRVQGLLGSVLKKRSIVGGSGNGATATAVSTPTSPGADEEVRNLRAQLEMQEVASSLRKADASFLQQQLEEKDDLLQEVSKILEAVEGRQIRLEEENAALRREVAHLRELHSRTTSSTSGLIVR